MKIVVLDGYTLNPGDLSWDGLKSIGKCDIYDRTSPQELVDRAQNSDIILTNKTVISAESLEHLINCKYIGVLATGYNIVDVDFARKRNIPVCNVPAYSTDSVAQLTLAHLLNLTQHMAHHTNTVRDGRWISSPDFCYWDKPLVELQGKVMGIIGLGRIGKRVAVIAEALGLEVIAHDPYVASDSPGSKMVNLEELFSQADIISLHCPLTKENERLINSQSISLMKKEAFLINTSRGPLIDEVALADALNTDRIAGAGLDVLSVEPAQQDNPLLTAKNCYITPHIAWATLAARKRLLQTTIENITAFLNGAPQNVVNNVL